MNIKQKIHSVVFGIFLLLGVTVFSLSGATVTAACDESDERCCGGVATSIISCSEGDGSGGGGQAQGTGIWYILLLVINIMTAGVGVLALAGIVYGAVLYTSAGGNAEQVKKAMGIFTNVVIGVVAFAGMYALLNFLIPGGAFNL